MTNDEQWIKTTCPRDFYGGCGIIVHKRNGEIFEVKGNREHPSTRGALLVYKSRWLKMENSRANVNVLCVAKKTDMGESTSVHATEVTVSRID